MPSVFYLGATGYIGGSVLVALVKRYPDWKINALVRSEKNFEAIRGLGVTVVEGSFSDKALITEQSRAADIVVNVADCDDVSLTNAILAGMKQRFDAGKPKGTLIHTSGLAIFFNDKTDGKFDPNIRIWNDANEEDMKSITSSMSHGQVDVPIFKAGEQGYVNTYILCPAGVVGALPAGVPVNNGTIFLKLVAQTYLKAQYGSYVGEGTNRFPLVHIEDVVDYYLRVFDIALNGKDAGASPYARYFVVTSNSVTWKELATAVTQDLHRRALLESTTPKSVTRAELETYAPYLTLFGADIHPVAGRGEGLGWKPRHIELAEVIEETMDGVLRVIGAIH